ncbi:hypothetical protein [Sphingomonas sp. M1-B02]|uniref:hypothetical protein n=1 Tax=Sphingomonas sp. M1-B02 TaxID=3114300 RepID=UPI00223FD513|nr:hypothetical protein [Sphingomonas sp. S6-11]UZK67128.1 hypothetical protein OKW87_04665 [Sphingomonas sp. S6-11]
MFRIDYDPRANVLDIHVSGFWKPEDVADFARAIGAKAHEARAIRDDFDVMVESLDFPVQANDVADLLTNVMRGGTTLTSGNVAVVVGSQLNRLQAERTLAHPRLKVFLSIDDARHWLDETGQPAGMTQQPAWAMRPAP